MPSSHSWLVHALAGGLGGQSAPLLQCTVDMASWQCMLAIVVWLCITGRGPRGAVSPPAAVQSGRGIAACTVHVATSQLAIVGLCMLWRGA